jgi:phosphotransferase family enzyme
MSIRRVDPRFVLPYPVERAIVLGGLDPWIDGLKEAGIEVSQFLSADSVPQLAVAPAKLAAEAVSTRAEMIMLEGRSGAASLRRAGLEVHSLIPSPSLAAPGHLVRADHRHAAVYAIEHWSIPTTLKRRVRNAVAKALLARGRFPDVLPVFTVGMRSKGHPFFLAAAEEFGVPRGSEWFMTLGGIDALSRSVFHVFPPGASEPGWVVKFARVPGYTAAFERDERGLRLAMSAGKAVGRHVPHILGRVEIAGLHASVEVAACGYRLADFLRRPIPRDEKLRVIDSVAAWIIELGRRTTANSATLRGERERLAREVVPLWSEFGIPSSLVDQVPQVPSVLQHADVGGWNVITRGPGDFAVIDWESVREHGFPLWDLVYFLADALVQLDGTPAGELRDQYTARLFRGELPLSETLFHWVRRAVRVFGLPPDAVGPVTTLCWLHHGFADVSRNATRGELGVGERWGEINAERFARLWVREPGLGAGWDSWRKG